ncbi:asparagine synthase-related protein [Halogeometricum luteum]|uniref:Asparagine synthase-related protein n=1 Tax=Halogeometricum luteum TaxID=2950537 RepID=A0ABU2G0S8_9EURY|nr:asparagine synthase-related protein [Halogeometricum sp. S3BR5-2]MDS0293768.1 asparagine synthase-related protein [Halogeometricum sp. S3BR5-2]
MTGICGVLGSRDHAIDEMRDDLSWTGEEQRGQFADEGIAVGWSAHPGAENEQPAETDDGTFVWAYGNVWGYESPDGDGYQPRSSDDAATIAEFCARRYEADGEEFAAGLNGSFVVVVYDSDEREALVVTDRLGTRPVYRVRPDEGTFVFSTQMQSLPVRPDVDAEFDVEYLAEYFTLGAVGGVRTPFTGVEELLPSSVTTVDLDAGTVDTERYWRPRYDPVDEPFSSFAERFVDRFETVLEERLDPDLTYGLLLSGGSDSRAILAGADPDIDLRTYHTAGWLNREAQVAEQVAFAADREFHLLRRDRDNHPRMLESTPKQMNFHGRFSEAHITEFGDRIRDEVDVLISGLGADTLFREHAFPSPRIQLGPLGEFDLPMAKRTTSVRKHIERRAKPLPEYLECSSDLTEILERNIVSNDGVDHHGVNYRSVRELVFFDDFYPFSNKSDYFFHALNGMVSHWSPFFDNRLVELALELPMRHRMRRNVIDATTVALDEDLARVPHASTGVPLTKSFPTQFLLHHANAFSRKHLSPDRSPEPYMSDKPWTNSTELLRTHDFAQKKLRERAPVMDALPFIDREAATRVYQDHLNGGEHTYVLYTLLSFLQMPAVQRMALGSDAETESDASESESTPASDSEERAERETQTKPN